VIGWSAGNQPVSVKLTGRYRVRVCRPALHEAKRKFVRVADLMEVRRHALKLRFWPHGAEARSQGQVLDLDWSWVQGSTANRSVHASIPFGLGEENHECLEHRLWSCRQPERSDGP